MKQFTFVFDVDRNTKPFAGRRPETVVVYQPAEDIDAACQAVNRQYGTPLILAAFEGEHHPVRGTVYELPQEVDGAAGKKG